jgi:hypothetical protein
MSGSEAVIRNSEAAATGEGYDIVLVSECCSDEDVAIVDRVFKDSRGSGPVIIGMGNLHKGSEAEK